MSRDPKDRTSPSCHGRHTGQGRAHWAAVALGLSALIPGAAMAGNGGYFTSYDHRVERGELEVMFMNDVTAPSSVNRADGQNNYASQMVEIEYGVTDQYASELMLESFVDADGLARFTGFRWENRYRLFKRETLLNPVLYSEYEHLDLATRYKMEVSGWVHPPYREEETTEEKDERILETRVILSHDFGATNVTFNWINETDLRNGRTDFGHALGVMHMRGGSEHLHGTAHHHDGTMESKEVGEAAPALLAGYGFELLGALGDDKSLRLSPKDQQHYFQPVVLLHPGHKMMLHAGVAIGLTPASDRVLFRTALGLEL